MDGLVFSIILFTILATVLFGIVYWAGLNALGI